VASRVPISFTKTRARWRISECDGRVHTIRQASYFGNFVLAPAPLRIRAPRVNPNATFDPCLMVDSVEGCKMPSICELPQGSAPGA